jgi:hypothetical protein
MFMDLASAPWALWVALGTVILGLVIAYGMLRTARRTRAEKAVTEAGTRRIYQEEDQRKHDGMPD